MSVWRALLLIVRDLLLALARGRKAKLTPVPTANPSRAQAPADAKRAAPISSKQLRELFEQRVSDQIVIGVGQIVKILKDDLVDTDGSGQHQQFLVAVDDELTIKISHNIKFGRIPADEGDELKFKGEYEWNELGGCVHWTHADPIKRHPDGWLEHKGQRFG